MGDSLTDARVGGGKFLHLLRKRCPKSQFDNYGKGGEMVNQMRHRFDGDVFGPGKPAYTHVIVFGGVNDLYSDLTAGRTPALIERDLTFMYQDARRHGARVVAVTVAPWGGFTRYWNASRSAATLEGQSLDPRAARRGAVDAVIDAYSMLSCGDPTVLCPAFTAPFKDGLHFGGGGPPAAGRGHVRAGFGGCAR